MTKAERTKKFIVEKAAELINRKGIAGTSLSDIMEATQLAKGGVYGNFESKDAICREAFTYLAEKQYSSIKQKLEEQPTARLKLFALLDYYNLRSIANSGGCHLLNFGTEADDTNPAMKQQVKKAMQKIESTIAELVSVGIANKEFKKSFDAAVFAAKAFSMIEGAVFASRIQNNNRHLLIITDALKKEIEENQL
jgi:AcrR family transcriptional regulator